MTPNYLNKSEKSRTDNNFVNNADAEEMIKEHGIECILKVHFFQLKGRKTHNAIVNKKEINNDKEKN